jgi:hypothetical protein
MNANDSRRAREVADLRPMLPVPAERDLPAGRRHILKEHLMTEFRADHPARPAVRTRRPRRMALAAAGACLLAAAAVTAGLIGLPGHSGSPAGGPGGQVAAAQLLSKIADAASRARAADVRDSQFEYIASEVSFGTGDGATPSQPHKRQIWIPVADLCGPGLLLENGQKTSLSERKQAGSVTGGNGQNTRDVGPRCPDRGSLNDPTYRLLQSLPTDPRVLLNLIYTTEKGAGQSPGQEAFTTIGDLLDESIAPPEVSAALYKAAALIPGVSVVPDAVDAIGRPGVAVSFTFNGEQSEWIFDKNTLQWLGERDFMNGTLTGKTAVLGRAFVDHPGEIPPVG